MASLERSTVLSLVILTVGKALPSEAKSVADPTRFAPLKIPDYHRVDIIDGGWGSGSFGGGGWGGGIGVVSRRGAVSIHEDIFQQITKLIEQTHKGITAKDLGVAAAYLQAAAAAALGDKEIPALDVLDVIDEVAVKFNGATAVSALFDDILTFEAKRLDAAVCLLEGLVKKARKAEAKGKSTDAAIAAVSMTAQAMQDAVQNSVRIYELGEAVNKNVKEGNPKRQRRQWSVGVHGGWSSGGGASVGTTISYRFGK